MRWSAIALFIALWGLLLSISVQLALPMIRARTIAREIAQELQVDETQLETHLVRSLTEYRWHEVVLYNTALVIVTVLLGIEVFKPKTSKTKL